jgi:hypothetical protein
MHRRTGLQQSGYGCRMAAATRNDQRRHALCRTRLQPRASGEQGRNTGDVARIGSDMQRREGLVAGDIGVGATVVMSTCSQRLLLLRSIHGIPKVEQERRDGGVTALARDMKRRPSEPRDTINCRACRRIRGQQR